jgi:hypothetical protein
MPAAVGITLRIMSELTDKEYEIAQWCFELVGVFNHYRFFTDKLWRKVSGFKNKDEAEVKLLLCIIGFIIHSTTIRYLLILLGLQN